MKFQLSTNSFPISLTQVIVVHDSKITIHKFIDSLKE